MANILLISYDNSSHIPFFPQHLFHLLGALKKDGHCVFLWFQDIHHGSGRHLTKILNDANFDMVCLGFVAGYWQYRKALALSEAINKSTNRSKFTYTIGGHGPGAEPEYFLNKLEADACVIGDGEEAICDIATGNVTGILQGVPCEDDEAPLSSYSDFPMDIYSLIRWPTSTNTDFCFPILSSRGCKWHCSFCYRMRKGYFMRSVEAIMEEIKFLNSQYKINHFQFSDELLMASEKRTEEICQGILQLPIKIKWDCNGRLNFAQTKTLKLMRKAGCEYINYGIESVNQDLLNEMKKGLTVDQIHSGVDATLKAKISPGLNLIWGFPGDTTKNLTYATEFLIKYDPCHELRTIRPVTPYPGTPLYKLAIEKGLLEGPEDFYERKHVNSDLFTVNFMDIETPVAHKYLLEANIKLVSNYYAKRQKAQLSEATRMYLHGDTTFRGFRAI